MGDRIKKLEQQMAQLMSRLPKKAPAAKKSKPRRRRNKKSQPMTSGELRLSKMELVSTVKIPANAGTNSGAVKVLAGEFPFLKGFSGSFERIQWLRLRFVYKPLVGTTKDGGVTLGFDWNYRDPKTTRADVACYSPTQTGSVFKEFSLTLPQAKLATRKWYDVLATGFDGGPGLLAWAIDGPKEAGEKSYGEIWVSYEIVLSGTTA